MVGLPLFLLSLIWCVIYCVASPRLARADGVKKLFSRLFFSLWAAGTVPPKFF
jgi:hypothetical protein